MAQICIVVFCGLPASGKTHVAQELDCSNTEVESKLFKFVIIKYDALLSPEVEIQLIPSIDDAECSRDSSWRRYRDEVVSCVDSLLSVISIHSSTDIILALQTEQAPQNVTPDLWFKFLLIVKDEFSQGFEGKKVCIIIDDNMYYRSMRYQYYQLARKYSLGFCQVHLHIDADIAKCQNTERELKVPDHVIVNMASKFEIPDGSKFGWEKHSISIACTETLSPVYELIRTALNDPVQKICDVDLELQTQSRVVCSQNFLHQCDQILRKLISQQMASCKDQGFSKEELRLQANRLLAVRKQIQDGLSSGSIQVPGHPIAVIKDGLKERNSDLFNHLREILLKHYPDIYNCNT